MARPLKPLRRPAGQARSLPDAAFAALATVVASLVVFAGGFLTAWFAFQSKDEELRVHLVEIAVGVLRADPKEDVIAARGWALDVIERNSGVPFSVDARAELLRGRWPAVEHADNPASNPLAKAVGKAGSDVQ